MADTPFRDRIITARESIEGADLLPAWREVVALAGEMVGWDFALELTRDGWTISYTHGNNYRDRLSQRGGYWTCPEDAIEALWRLAESRARACRDLFEEAAE